ncbi:hypothetical protein SMMN14_07243 [Sphaerulina musiva]
MNLATGICYRQVTRCLSWLRIADGSPASASMKIIGKNRNPAQERLSKRQITRSDTLSWT